MAEPVNPPTHAETVPSLSDVLPDVLPVAPQVLGVLGQLDLNRRVAAGSPINSEDLRKAKLLATTLRFAQEGGVDARITPQVVETAELRVKALENSHANALFTPTNTRLDRLNHLVQGIGADNLEQRVEAAVDQRMTQVDQQIGAMVGQHVAQHMGQHMDRYMAQINHTIAQHLSGVNQRFDGIDRRFGLMDQQFKEHLGLMGRRFEERLGLMERRFDGIDRRFDGIDRRLATISGHVDNLKGSVSEIQNSIRFLEAFSNNSRIISINKNSKPSEYIPIVKTVPGHGLAHAIRIFGAEPAARPFLVEPRQIAEIGATPPGFVNDFAHLWVIIALMIFYNEDFGILSTDSPSAWCRKIDSAFAHHSY